MKLFLEFFERISKRLSHIMISKEGIKIQFRK
ncbi:hypothetical protein BSHJ18_01188 [Bacillus velezensis]|nr:hypothetical protein BSHJ18_01188 [Bacillus velezensis]